MYTNPGFRKGEYDNTFLTLKGLDDKRRKELILEFLESHEGCLVKDVVEEFENRVKDGISKKPVHRFLTELANDGLIINKSNNKRDIRYIINKQNEYIKLNDKIKAFIEKFFNLLQNYENNSELVQMKEKIDRDKIGNMKDEKQRNEIQNLIDEYHKGEKEFHRIYFYIVKIKQYVNEIMNLEEEIGDLLKNRISSHDGKIKQVTLYGNSTTREVVDSNAKYPRYHENKREFAEEIERSILKIQKLLPRYKMHSRKSGLLRINMWSIYLLILFLHRTNYSNIMRWPYVISDEKMILNLNTLLYQNILEINAKLYHHINLNKHTSSFITSLIKGEGFNSFMNIQDERFYQMVIDYQNFDLDKEIMAILKLIVDDKDILLYNKLFSLDELLETKLSFCRDILKDYEKK